MQKSLSEIVCPGSAARLVLADGSVFHGISIGASGCAAGEVVFNTAMTGYQEILTDPSYAGQIITLTYPHIGNTGTNTDDNEALTLHCKGLVVRDLSSAVSNWRSELNLSEFLKQHGIVAIADIDTRRLTRLLRDSGAQNALIVTDNECSDLELSAKAQALPSLAGQDLAKQVTVTEPYEWKETTWQYPLGCHARKDNELLHHVVVYDFGVKRNILRMLVAEGCSLTVVPATTPIDEVLKLQPDGVVLSNGPGDPGACDYAVKHTQTLLKSNIPVLGICLGFQIMMLALGAKTYKMKFGHHGANHPVQDERNKRVFITSQNHGFAVDETSLPQSVDITHRSLFDGTVQGVMGKQLPIIGFQGHPEASPGPQDISGLFAEFVKQLLD